MTQIPGFTARRCFPYKVYQRGDCWEWRGCRLPSGYGNVHVNGTTQLAHRMAYEIAKGKILPGYQIDHLCRHRWCVRPSHLEAVLPKENTRRSRSPAAENAKKTHCRRGHALTKENIYLRIRYERECRACLSDRARERSRIFHERHSYTRGATWVAPTLTELVPKL